MAEAETIYCRARPGYNRMSPMRQARVDGLGRTLCLTIDSSQASTDLPITSRSLIMQQHLVKSNTVSYDSKQQQARCYETRQASELGGDWQVNWEQKEDITETYGSRQYLEALQA
nr:hypothetical protein CFP56_33599 [Quercus suber]